MRHQIEDTKTIMISIGKWTHCRRVRERDVQLFSMVSNGQSTLILLLLDLYYFSASQPATKVEAWLDVMSMLKRDTPV